MLREKTAGKTACSQNPRPQGDGSLTEGIGHIATDIQDQASLPNLSLCCPEHGICSHVRCLRELGLPSKAPAADIQLLEQPDLFRRKCEHKSNIP